MANISVGSPRHEPMPDDLQKLLDDPRFLRYHAVVVKPRTFNPFDVLRYSDYEIRHSNVLAWLLQPDETHGIGGAFIRDFTAALNDEARAQDLSPVPAPSSFEADNIRVERELDYVDITLFFERERAVVAIENKISETAPEHAEQVRGYEKTLRKTYRGKYDVIRSVLLTTSRDPGASGDDFIHMSWTRVRDMVNSIRKHERFTSEEGERVRAFLGQYLEVVAKLTAQPRTESNYFSTLLDDYGHVLNGLLTEREEGAGSGDAVSLPNDLGKYRTTVDRLVNDFRQKPRNLRSDAQTFLRGRGFRTWTYTSSAYQTYYLYFSNAGMEETRKSLGLSWQPRWSLIFGHREVLLQLQIDPPKKEWGPAVDRITEFMKQHPIDTSRERKGRYPLGPAPWAANCFMVYRHLLMTDADLSATPTSEIKEATLRRVESFLDEDYRRIETYLQCMAFDPAVRT